MTQKSRDTHGEPTFPEIHPKKEGLTRRELISGMGGATIGLAIGAPLLEAAQPGAAGSAGQSAAPALREVRMIENVWIPMSDGTRIAARMWLPVDAEKHKVPAIMEYIPYRKRDRTRVGSDSRHPHWAAHGYACIRPDIRGSGDSDGILVDEYVKQEQDDGVEIIEWLARQPWCSGSVGLVGISWGGFSALQVAARHPPALKAIITHCSTDDRYTDDAHYMGGCINQDMFVWGSKFFNVQASPPDPQIVGPDRWRSMWKERLEKLDCRVADWLRHPTRDEFWKHGSVNENYDDIKCAVYAVGGWVDAYSTAIPRMLNGLKAPRKGLIGPWGHNYPSGGVPGPAIDYLSDSLRWWDHWLKGVDTGIMDEPMLRVWMQDKAACCGMMETPGRWVAEEHWPSRRIENRHFYLTGDGLASKPGAPVQLQLAPAQTVGMVAGHWCPFDMPTELPKEQGIDDGRSLCFDSEPLGDRLEILGAPLATVEVAVDRPVAMLAVRLNELHADGTSTRITYGVLNLTHRNSSEFPEPLVPGERYRIAIQMKDIAHSFAPGSRIRVAVSTSYWPLIMPMPEAVRLELFAGSSSLSLPVRPRGQLDSRLAELAPAPPRDPPATEVLREGIAPAKRFEMDMATGTVTVRSTRQAPVVRLREIGTVMASGWEDSMTIRDSDPHGATTYNRNWESWERADWKVRVETVMRLTMNKTEYVLDAEVTALENDATFFTRTWHHKIPRRLI